MSCSKEFELVAGVLIYAIRCLAEGDHTALRSMNFGPQEVDTLRKMNISDLYRIDSLRAHCLEISVNKEIFGSLVKRLQDQRESEELQHDLIAEDAPLDLMQSLFGLGPREYTRLRRMLSLSPSVGRPADADDISASKLWYEWQNLTADREDPLLLSGADYLILQKKTGITLRAIWNLTQRWKDYGDLSGYGEPPN